MVLNLSCITSVSAFNLPWHTRCVSLYPDFSLLIRIALIVFECAEFQYNLILTWLYVQRPHFCIRSPLQALEVRTSIYLLGDTGPSFSDYLIYWNSIFVSFSMWHFERDHDCKKCGRLGFFCSVTQVNPQNPLQPWRMPALEQDSSSHGNDFLLPMLWSGAILYLNKEGFQKWCCRIYVNPNLPIHPTPPSLLGSICLFSTSLSLFLLCK